MLYYICNRLNIGKVTVNDHFASYIVTSTDLFKIIEIFDNYPLNTSKHLNYLAFREGFLLYNNNKDKNNKEVSKYILTLKDSMNKKRIKFKMPSNHTIKITPY